ncbi:MAG: arsinothricin resistance N-acetyltransferase ArsN1 family B [Streptosporangiaceae bacterium]
MRVTGQPMAGSGPEAGRVAAAGPGKGPGLAAAIGVRAAATADAESIAAIYAPVVTGSAISFEETPPGPDEVSRRMLGSPRLPWLVADDAGRVAGYAYASAHRQRPAYRWSADCSVYLDPGYRGHGLGRLLYENLISEVRDLGYVSLFAGIALPNAASVGLHEAVGFRPVGVFRDVGYKFGAWRDVGWWQLRLRDRPADPGEPRPWAPPADREEDGGHGQS